MMSFSLATQSLSLHVCMFRENRRANVVAAFYSLSHIPRHPLGVWLKSAIRQNTEHSRLEHFIHCFQNPRQRMVWGGRGGPSFFFPKKILRLSLPAFHCLQLCKLPDHPCRDELPRRGHTMDDSEAQAVSFHVCHQPEYHLCFFCSSSRRSCAEEKLLRGQ